MKIVPERIPREHPKPDRDGRYYGAGRGQRSGRRASATAMSSSFVPTRPPRSRSMRTPTLPWFMTSSWPSMRSCPGRTPAFATTRATPTPTSRVRSSAPASRSSSRTAVWSWARGRRSTSASSTARAAAGSLSRSAGNKRHGQTLFLARDGDIGNKMHARISPNVVLLSTRTGPLESPSQQRDAHTDKGLRTAARDAIIAESTSTQRAYVADLATREPQSHCSVGTLQTVTGLAAPAWRDRGRLYLSRSRCMEPQSNLPLGNRDGTAGRPAIRARLDPTHQEQVSREPRNSPKACEERK